MGWLVAPVPIAAVLEHVAPERSLCVVTGSAVTIVSLAG
jgi:hypothetical protein